MGKRSAMGLAVAVLAVSSLFAETLSTVKTILTGPVGYLFTKEERRALEKLTSEAEVAKYMELFWAKRDPDLNTPMNEFKVDFEARVKAADKMFTVGSIPGSLTDRGHVLILLGKPSKVSQIPAGPLVTGSRGGEGGTHPYEDQGATEIWIYAKGRVSEAVVKAEEVWAVFVETRLGSNEFILDRSERRNAHVMKLFANLPEKLIKHPKLTEVPKVGLLSGSKAARAEELAVFQQGEVWADGARFVYAQGLVAPSFHPLWLFIELPDAVPPAATVVGRVTKDNGEEVGTFSKEITPLSVANGRGYEFSLPLSEGKFIVALALLDAGRTPLVVKNFSVELAPVASEGTVISPCYWGVDVRQEAAAHLGDPFNIGGWHVIPRPSNTYSSNENLAYFFYVLHPQVGENGQLSYQVSLAVFKDNKKLTENKDQSVSLSQVSPDLWMFGNGLPLSVFRKAGEYVLEVTLRDTKSNVEAKARIPIIITVP